MIKSGQLRDRVTVQTRDAGTDALGGPMTTWSDYSTAPGRVQHVGGGKVFAGYQFTPETTHHVTMRWIDGVDSNMRLLVHSEAGQTLYLEIMFINYSERRQDDEMTLVCKERTDWVPATD